MKSQVRIGSWAAFWGDTPHAARQVLQVPDIDYLVGDHLAEVTMALLARARAKDPEAGFVGDAVSALTELLPTIAERGIKVVTNAGALNAVAMATALQAAVDEAGAGLRVAAVHGDDLLPEKERFLADHPRDLFTDEEIPAELSSMNAYLGAFPIARALADGADIVVTGRCVDAAVVLGPLIHEFGWTATDYDLLSGGTLVGHLVECGPQGMGGLHTDWWAVPGWDDMGYPVAEIKADGTAIITKPEGTGGLVTPATVGEQVVYEIGDPGNYITPDVVCDWRNISLEQAGPDRVAVSGAKGTPPTTTYKVTATYNDGYRVMATWMFAGLDAAARARRAGEAMVSRTERLNAEAGLEPLSHVSIEVVGGGDLIGGSYATADVGEAVLKVGLRHKEKPALEVFARESAAIALVAMGMSGAYAGRPRVAPVFAVYHLLTSKAAVPVTVVVGDQSTSIDVAPGEVDRPEPSPTTASGPPEKPTRGTVVPLRRIAYGRSGDKGNKANIGLIARRPEFVELIRAQVSTERVASAFEHLLGGQKIDAWELPGISAFNFLLDDVLGGTGGTSTLRYDAQGKSFAAQLLGIPVVVPHELSDLLGPGAPA
ncbi:acyclic terpene utilization AtuA family protein [Patulibacter minatonensis]|uniref:acyclic terpene utilization AtuA family protein n=1 Tax=Patulibacter minatonensis TaxID=298163 RepID=UPI00047A005A|nr:acyclic terpene utilization AtuA family protein [Patulibacter minatonensis]